MLNLDIDKLEECIETAEKSLRGGLISIDLWDRTTGLSLAGRNSQLAATALFNQITQDLKSTLDDAGFPTLNDYYLIDVTEGKLVVVLRATNDFLGGMLLDAEKTNLGILVGVVIPRTLELMRQS